MQPQQRQAEMLAALFAGEKGHRMRLQHRRRVVSRWLHLGDCRLRAVCDACSLGRARTCTRPLVDGGDACSSIQHIFTTPAYSLMPAAWNQEPRSLAACGVRRAAGGMRHAVRPFPSDSDYDYD
jgi:hypothetical protein